MIKKPSFKIGQKLYFAFIVIILLVFANVYLNISINRSDKLIEDKMSEIYEPLMESLKSLENLQEEARKLVANWLESQSMKEKQDIKNIINITYPSERVEMGRLLLRIDDNRQFVRKIKQQLKIYDEVIALEKEMLDNLTTKADFENSDRVLYCKNLLEKSIIPMHQMNVENMLEIKNDLNSIQKNENLEHKKSSRLMTYNIYLFSLIVIAIILILLSNIAKINGRLKVIQGKLGLLAIGNLTEKIEDPGKDELGSLEKEINTLRGGMGSIKNFILEVGRGNFKAKTDKIEKWGDIGNSLKEMSASLEEIENKQEEQRKEEEIRNWITSGIAHFNEILRIKNDNIDELAYDIVKELVKYTEAIIGGVYITRRNSQGEMKLSMSGLFAYERKRYVETEIEPGEGLIGTVYIERHKIHLLEIPEDYLNISSGLGEAPPKELLIVPLAHNEEIHGVIEIATLNTFKEYTIEFIEKIADGLASTISSVLINMETAKLLEESKEKAEELHAQEEELRQNMEELQAAQDEKSRQSLHIESTQKNLEEILANLPFPVFVKDENKKYLMVNKKQEELLGIKSKDLFEQDDSSFILDEEELKAIDETDNRILKGEKRVELPEQKITLSDGKVRKLRTIKVPVLNNVSNQLNILGISYYI